MLTKFYGTAFFVLLLMVSMPGGVAHGQEEGDATSVGQIEQQQDEIKKQIEELNQRRQSLDKQEEELARTLKNQAERLTEQRDAMEEQARLIRQQKEFLDMQRRKIESLKVQMDELALPPVDVDTEQQPPPEPAPPAAPAPAPAPPPQSAPQSAPQSQEPPPSGPVGQAPPPRPERPAQIADEIQSDGVLTHRGTLILEPSLSYSYSSVTRVALEGFTIIPAITVGAIDVREVDRNTYIGALGLRYGVTDHFEVGLRVPFVHRNDTTVTRPLAVAADADVTTEADGSGLGDVELILNYMFNKGRGRGPHYVASLRAKSRSGTDPFETEVDPQTGLQTHLPTGSGFWSVQPGISMSVPSDPAVFYGSLSYLYNIAREVRPATGEIDPGDAVGLSFGMAFAINPRASFSLGYSHASVAETKQDGIVLPGSDRLQVGTLLLGLSHRVGNRRNINISMGAGLTEDAPDMQLSFRMPIAYVLFGK